MGSLGRRREERIDAALFQAVTEILTEDGYQGLKLEHLLERSGSNRPSLYRRYGSLTGLALALYRDRYGHGLYIPDHGDLSLELYAIQQAQADMFTDPIVTRGLPGFLDALNAKPELMHEFTTDVLEPRRTVIKDVIGRAVLRGEIEVPTDIDWIYQILTGPFLTGLLIPDMPQTGSSLPERTTRLALHELGWTGTFDPSRATTTVDRAASAESGGAYPRH